MGHGLAVGHAVRRARRARGGRSLHGGRHRARARAGGGQRRRGGRRHRRRRARPLPGGIGTLEELFEVYTWAQLGIHAKPLGLIDVAGYYRPLVAFLDHAVHERFLRPETRTLLAVGEGLDDLLARLETWEPVTVHKWIDLDQA